jgi:hypothetical protein
MPKVVIAHSVVDIDRWLAGKAERAELIGPVGKNVQDHVALDGSNQAAVTVEVDDMAALQAMVDSPPAEVAGLMEKHGVIPPLTIYVEK